MSRANEQVPGKRTPRYEDVQMIELHKLVREANSFQKSEQYSLRDERGETFSLTFWSGYRVHETVLIPAGTRQEQHQLQLAIDTMRKQIDTLRHSFGRYMRDEG